MNNHQVGRAGEHFVAAELHRRGAYAVTFAGNMPRIDILASDLDQTRTVAIQVKTMRSGSWQTSIKYAVPVPANPADDHFWILVHLGRSLDASPAYYIAPEPWMLNDIYEKHAAYLAKHGGVRPGGNPDSKHHSIRVSRVADWRDRWDLLGIF